METRESTNFIDWSSDKSHLLENPWWSKEDHLDLQELFNAHPLHGHIWIASSGSSRKKNESLKLIALSKQAFLTSAAAVNKHLKSNKNDIWIQVLPQFHVGGLSIYTRAHLSGAKVINGLDRGIWNAQQFVSIAENEGATLSAMVPTQIFDLVTLSLKSPKSMRAIVVGGASLSAELYFKARSLGWPLLPSYGLTECCSQVATADLKSLTQQDYPRLKILKHCQVRNSIENFLEVKSSALMTGYAQKINGQIKWYSQEIGHWYLTTDKVEIHSSFLIPQGRDRDFIKINGEGINLAKLREVLSQVVSEVSPEYQNDITLFAKRQERSGFELFLVYANSIRKELIQKIQDKYNRRVSSLERLSKIQSVEKIPRSALGKITELDAAFKRK